MVFDRLYQCCITSFRSDNLQIEIWLGAKDWLLGLRYTECFILLQKAWSSMHSAFFTRDWRPVGESLEVKLLSSFSFFHASFQRGPG